MHELPRFAIPGRRWVNEWLAAAACAALCLAPAPARALDWDALGGHLSVGYAKPFNDPAPSGSFSGAGGMDHGVNENLRLGVDIGFHMLGSETLEKGSLFSTIDYSLFEASLLAHWSPSGRLWYLNRVSFGPAFMSARAQPSGGGAGFAEFAVDEKALGAVVDLTLMKAEAPLRLGLELGYRRAFLPGDDWLVGTLRAAIHY